MDQETTTDDYTTIQKLKYPDPPGRLKLELEVETVVPASECLIELFVHIKWRPEGEKKSVAIGQIEAWIVDKTLRSEAGEKLWISDFSSLDDDHTVVGIRDLNQTFFDSAGRRKRQHQKLAEALNADRFVFVNKVYLEPAWRAARLGTHALSTFHEQLRGMPKEYALDDSTLLLQPEYLGEGEGPKPKERARAQQQLLRFYTRNGYQVYYQEQPELLETKGTYMVMGRRLAPNADEQQSKSDSDDSDDSDESDEPAEDETESMKDTEHNTFDDDEDDDGEEGELISDQ